MPFKFNPFTDKLDEVTAAGPSAGVSTINTIAPTGGGNFTLTPGAGISITPGVNSVTIADTNTPVSEQQIYYVAKSGNDANSGLNIENAVLTFGHAITLATAQTPSSTNRFAIWCFDDGIYTEDIVGVPYVDIFAPNATLVATTTGLTVADNSNYTILAMQVPDSAFGVLKTSLDVATSWVNIDEITCAGAGVGFANISASGGVLQCQWKTLTIEDGVGVGDVTSSGHMHVKGGDIYITGVTGNAIGLGRALSGSIVGNIDHILGVGAAVGTAVYMTQGEIDVNINNINIATLGSFSINIDGTAGSCVLNLVCNTIIGTQSSTNGAILNIWSPIPSGSAGQLLSSQGPGLPPQWLTVTPGAGIGTIDGDSGSISGSSVSLLANSGSANCGSSVSFTAASATELDLVVTDGNDNTVIGFNAGKFGISGAFNTAFGSDAYSSGGSSGNNNTFIGQGTGAGVKTGSGNTAIGASALQGFDSANNTAVGFGALGQGCGNSNIGIGYNVGQNYSTTEANNILIGNSGIASENNAIHIGTPGAGAGQQNACFIAGIDGTTVTGTAVLCSATGQLGDVVSSREFKENIQDLSDESSSLLKLRPVRFNYKSDPNKTTSYGMIAEEVDEIFPELVIYKDHKPYSIKYHEMPALLLNEIQKLKQEVCELKSKLEAK